MNELTDPPSTGAKKYRAAAWMFMVMNLAYLVITYLRLPPMGLDVLQMAGYTALLLALSGAFAWFVYRGARALTILLALLYAGRASFAVYTLIGGSAFPIVPWVLPTIVIAFYCLGRAAWDWP